MTQCTICNIVFDKKTSHKHVVELKPCNWPAFNGYKSIYIDGIETIAPTNKELFNKYVKENKKFISKTIC